MDGIAVRAADTVGASDTTPITLTDFDVVDTGDPVPQGRDAVVMREHVHLVGPESDPDSGAATKGAELVAAAVPYQHVRSVGEDVAADGGGVVLDPDVAALDGRHLPDGGRPAPGA